MFFRAPVSQFVQWDQVCDSQVFYLRTLCPHKICIYNRRGRGRRGGVWGISAAELPPPQLPRPFSRSSVPHNIVSQSQGWVFLGRG